GVLMGKYFDGARPAGARLTLFDRFTRYFTPQAEPAAKLYVEIARRHGLDPAQMALAYVNSRPFVTSNIIGATNLEQLDANIRSAEVTLSAEVLSEIEAAHQVHPYPCP
ncbi:MAG: aldo/keto reductase, partial [Elstera sp.]